MLCAVGFGVYWSACISCRKQGLLTQSPNHTAALHLQTTTHNYRHKGALLLVRPLQSPDHNPCNLHQSLHLVNTARGGGHFCQGPQPQDADLIPDRVSEYTARS